VLTKHQYSSAGILQVINLNNSNQYEDDKLNKKVETDIFSKGMKLLERLVDLNELKRMLKQLKENIANFNPANHSSETLTQLENGLLFFIPILKIKSFFTACFSDVLDAIKALIKKEIAFIEQFKRDKNNEKNPKYNEIIESSGKRMQIELGVLKNLLESSCQNYSEAPSEEAKVQYANAVKDIINVYTEVFDKYTDPKNLTDLVSHLNKNVNFLVDNDQGLNSSSATSTQNSSSGPKKPGPEKKNEETVVEKMINGMMNLLRKNGGNDEGLCEEVVSSLVNLAKKRGDICNILVKAGCPRLLLQLIENTSNRNLVEKCLELLKLITLSNQENLEMLSNQSL
jgi:hypothetical protein